MKVISPNNQFRLDLIVSSATASLHMKLERVKATEGDYNSGLDG